MYVPAAAGVALLALSGQKLPAGHGPAHALVVCPLGVGLLPLAAQRSTKREGLVAPSGHTKPGSVQSRHTPLPLRVALALYLPAGHGQQLSPSAYQPGGQYAGSSHT